jgi:hypothetical protein
MQTAIRSAYKAMSNETRKRFLQDSKQPSILWSLLRGQWTMMDSEQKLAFRAGIVQLLGYPVVNGDAKLGAKLLLAKEGEALSKDITALLLPKVAAVLDELSSLPEPDASMLGFLIYDY